MGSERVEASLQHTLYNRWGSLDERSGDQVTALERYRKTKELAQARMQADAQDIEAQTIFSIAVAHIGMQETRLGIAGDGIAKLDEAVAQVEKAYEADPAQSFYADLLVVGYAYQAELAVLNNDLRAARAKYALSLKTAEMLAEQDRADLESRLSISKMHAALGVVAAKSGNYTEARQEFGHSLSATEPVLWVQADDTETKYVAANVQKAITAITNCVDGQVCPAGPALRLPDPLN